MIIWTAFEAWPVSIIRYPRAIIPPILQNKAPFSCANATSSSVSAFAAAYFPLWMLVYDASLSANIRVAAWPISRACLSAPSASASAASG